MTAQQHNHETIPADKLVISKANIRKSPATADENKELKASIEANGILSPLMAHKIPAKDLYEVVDGGRRLNIINDLIKAGTLPADHPVSCTVLHDSADIIEISTTANLVRAGMHPIDEFEAFHAMHYTSKTTIADIAAHFGKSELEVKKRLALGDVHPDLRKQCRDGKLDLDCLMAYAGTSDKKQQMKIYRALKKQDEHDDKYWVRAAINDAAYSSEDYRVKFIGLETYQDAGGTITEDLFGETIRLNNTSLVDKLVNDKLADTLSKACKGWKWGEIQLGFNEWATPLKKIDPAGRNNQHTKAQMLELGVIVDINRNGRVEISKGWARPEDKKAAQAASRKKTPKKSAGGADTGEGSGDSGNSDDQEDLEQYNYSLQHDLDGYKLMAAKLELVDHHELMTTVMLFSTLYQFFTADRYSKESSFIHLSIDPSPPIETSRNDIEGSDMQQLLEQRKDDLDLSWLHDSEVDSFNEFQHLSMKKKEALIAYCTTVMLKRDTALLDLLLRRVDANPAKHWRPTADNFFTRITQKQRLHIVEQVLGVDAPAAQKKMKKGELSNWLEDQVNEQRPETSWMPKELTSWKETE